MPETYVALVRCLIRAQTAAERRRNQNTTRRCVDENTDLTSQDDDDKTKFSNKGKNTTHNYTKTTHFTQVNYNPCHSPAYSNTNKYKYK